MLHSPKQPSKAPAKIYSTAFRLLITVAISVFAAETFVMFFFVVLPPFSPAIEPFVNASLLTVLILPILYIFSFRPLISKRRRVEEELKKHREHLEDLIQQRTAELLSANTKLEDEIKQRSLTQTSLQHHIKQLNCLYGLSRLVERSKVSLEQIFQQSLNLIRSAYQHPDAICVRITFNGIQYKTDNFEKTELSQWADIRLRGQKAGIIEVYCLKEKTQDDMESFLPEERDLLKAVAEHLGRIAERTRAREKLRLFRNLIDRSNDCIFLLEPKWGRFLDVNDRACESLGYTQEELLTMSLKDIEQSIPGNSAWQKQTEQLKLKESITIEGRHKRKDGSTFFAETALKLVSQQKEDYIIAIARDITERKLAEQAQAELLKQVESTNQELKDFAYVISHDLKAPLRGISTLAEWLSTDYADKLDENGKEQIGLLSSRVERMHNLIDGVLEYSKVGHIREKHVQINLNQLVPEIIDTLAAPESIEITIENELPVIKCEQTRIIQVFQNLLSNAIKYIDKPEGIIRIGCVEEQNFWKFSVADNGPGIEQKYFEKIFKIFQTVSSQNNVESTGVGLTVVKKIIDMYDGQIWVESEPGQGTTFFFTLPKQEMGVGSPLLQQVAKGEPC